MQLLWFGSLSCIVAAELSLRPCVWGHRVAQPPSIWTGLPAKRANLSPPCLGVHTHASPVSLCLPTAIPSPWKASAGRPHDSTDLTNRLPHTSWRSSHIWDRLQLNNSTKSTATCRQSMQQSKWGLKLLCFFKPSLRFKLLIATELMKVIISFWIFPL